MQNNEPYPESRECCKAGGCSVCDPTWPADAVISRGSQRIFDRVWNHLPQELEDDIVIQPVLTETGVEILPKVATYHGMPIEHDNGMGGKPWLVITGRADNADET